MDKPIKVKDRSDFENRMRKYIKEGRTRLENELHGTREAIKHVAEQKTRKFIEVMDKGLSSEERAFLNSLIVASMSQAFCFGYGIGKIEGITKDKVCL